MFGGGGGGFGAPGTGFGASTPFGSSTVGQQGSAFGGGGTTFGSSTTNTFGAKPTFGATSTTGGFGSSSAFGAPAPAASNVFGGAAGTSAFGRTTSTSPFGAAAPAPSTGAFGSTTTSAFGATAPATNPFGAPAPSAGLGGFGSSATSSNPFGKPASSPFGAPAPAPGTGGVFGAAPATTTGFRGFGTQPTAGGGLFGSTVAAPATGAFGAPAPTAGAFSGFGTTGGVFGAASVQQQGTGNPAWRQTRAEDPTGKSGTNPGMLMSISAMKEYAGKSHEELRVEDYLQNRKASTGFGTTINLGGTTSGARGSLFGGFGATPTAAPATAPAFGFGAAAPAPSASPFGFGTPAPAPAGGGFAGFGASPAPATGGLFGAPSPSSTATTTFGSSGFGFGSTPAPAPASTSTFGFGSTTPQPAPAAGGGLFGSTPAPAAGVFSFGQSAPSAAPAPSAFGSSFGFGTTPAPAAPAPAGFSFGTTPALTSGAFGAPAPAPTGGLFGSNLTPAPAPGAFSFAKPAAPSAPGAFSFGTSSGFGAAAKPTPTFGGLSTATGGLFGAAPAPAGAGFSFGTSPAAPAPAPSSGFGTFAGFGSTATSAFGAPAPAGGGLFGGPAPGSAFGASAQQQQQQQQRVAVHNQDPYGAAGNPGFGSGALEQKVKGVENSSQLLAISFERGTGGGGGGSGFKMGASVGNPAPSVGFAYRRTPRSSARIRPRGLAGGGDIPGIGGDGGNNHTLSLPSSSRLLSEGSLTPSGAGKSGGILSPDVYLSGGIKRLNIPTNTEERRPRFSESRPLIKPLADDGGTSNGNARRGAPTENGGSGTGGSGGGAEEAKRGEASIALTETSTPNGTTSYRNGNNGRSRGQNAGVRGEGKSEGLSSPDGSARRGSGGASGVHGEIASPPPSSGVGTDVRAAAGGGGGDDSLPDDGSPAGGGGVNSGGGLFDGDGDADTSAFAPTLDVEGYETTPAMSELVTMNESSLKCVSGFSVSRPDFGSIKWKEPVDLRRLDIGKVVVIERKAASVYDELPEGEEKPPEGQGLNKPTTVTLFRVFPKRDNLSDEEKRQYEEKVRKRTAGMGATLVHYSADTGTWVFETPHWSRYAMDDSGDEDDGGDSKNSGGTATKLMPPPPPVRPPERIARASATARGGAGPSGSAAPGRRPSRRPTKYSMPDTDDEGSVVDNASDAGGVGAVATASHRAHEDAQGGHGREDADMEDVDYAEPVADAVPRGTKEGSWSEPRLPANTLFHTTMDMDEVESMCVAVDRGCLGGAGGGNSSSRAVAAGGSELSTGPPMGVALESASEQSPWERLSVPRPLPRPVLGDSDDVQAAAAFRPAVRAPDSHVLRLLASAWEPEATEVKDEAVRGALRAGKMIADLGLRSGRGFRASWGPGGRLVFPGAIGGGNRATPGSRAVRLLQFDPTPAASGRDARELYVEPLRNHKRFAEPVISPADALGRAMDDSAPPRWALPQRMNDHPENYDSLVRCMHGYVKVHAAAAAGRTGAAGDLENSPEWVLEQMWRLAGAMWGQEQGEGKLQDLPMPGEELTCAERGGDTADGISDGAFSASRREEAVADWLANAVSSCVPVVPPGDNPWRSVLELLSVRRIDDAAKLAMRAGLPRLAVVLAAATAGSQGGAGWVGARCPCDALAKQAQQWQSTGADARMPQEALTVFQLLGRECFRDVQLRGLVGGEVTNARHPSLDWLRQLGLCLWFGAGSSLRDNFGTGSVGVAEAVEAFELLVAKKEALVPTARYFHEPTHHDKSDLKEVCAELRRAHIEPRASGRDRCVLSRLLALYPPRKSVTAAGSGGSSALFPGTALLTTMEPLAVSPDVMDYRHSWHLMTVVEALGVAHVSDRCKAAAVAESLRFQLVVAGLWEWAVYVALSAEGSADRREATARELVVRYGHELLVASAGSLDKKRADLLLDFGVPEAWLYEAAAVRAGYEHKSAMPAPVVVSAAPRKRTVRGVGDGQNRSSDEFTAGSLPELNREAKLGLLISAASPRLAMDAASEACRLAPSSLYLGRDIESLMNTFQEISRLLEMAERKNSSFGVVGGSSGGRGSMIESGDSRYIHGGGRTEEFDAYKAILEAVGQQLMGGEELTREDMKKICRFRDDLEPAAAKVTGQVVAHEALSTIWKVAGLAAE